MPTYEYECKSCSHNFEVFQSINDPPVRDCPECGAEVRRLIFGGTGVIFKGSGFYVTDKSKSSARSEASGTRSEASSESKPCPAAKQGETCAGCPKAEASAGSAEKAKPESKSA